MANERLMSLQDVIKITELARSTIYYMMEKGTFPRPLKIGQRKARWRKDDVNGWL